MTTVLLIFRPGGPGRRILGSAAGCNPNRFRDSNIGPTKGMALAKCFVVMPVSTPEILAQRYNDSNHFKHVLDHLFTPALTSVNYEVVPPSASGSDLIHAEIIRNLEECDLVLCDISTLNPNVFFELGIRISLDRAVALVRDNFTTNIPFDTGSINTYTYESPLRPWTLESEISGLARHIAETAEKSRGRNSLWRYFGLTQRAVPAEIANPTEAKLDLLIAELSKANRQFQGPEPPTYAGLGARIEQLISLAEEEAAKLIQTARSEANEIKAAAIVDAAEIRAIAKNEATQLRTADGTGYGGRDG